MSVRSIHVSLNAQQLKLISHGEVLKEYYVSTSKRGGGESINSFQTPRGRHIVRAKIGDRAAEGTVFRGRRSTGEIYSEELAFQEPNKDWVLTRILWLSGTEVGRNRLGSVDTMRRYIYIHGTPYTDKLGEPASVGCIRMNNTDITELYELVPIGTVVEIVD